MALCSAMRKQAKLTPKTMAKYLLRSPISIFRAIQVTAPPPFRGGGPRAIGKAPGRQSRRREGMNASPAPIPQAAGRNTPDAEMAYLRGLLAPEPLSSAPFRVHHRFRDALWVGGPGP